MHIWRPRGFIELTLGNIDQIKYFLYQQLSMTTKVHTNKTIEQKSKNKVQIVECV